MKIFLSIAAVIVFSLSLTSNGAAAECDLRVMRVSDGDTFHARTYTVISAYVAFSEDSGFRLHNVRSPERPTRPTKGEADPSWPKYAEEKRSYDKATDDLKTLISGRLVSVVIAEKRPRDRWGRFIVKVAACDGTDVNQAMRDKGWTNKGR